ncbi:hypothetical protein CHL78_007380 [Romboutsia weinsteinii]|uniref:Uncharacterized protein n=1 Tax=Romboutsia weinsteinii TaxID=2020949 RepID=A0A371J4V7_9FIRM|nr:hypothetical protein [Romboutsia weinsteinii]RDY27820.1 hypothetical protein CHL78_007380 [Romboutsia weinsteinii]
MTIVGILGSIHGDDSFRLEKGYTLEMMKEVIVEFNPDIICGEVRPEDWDKYCNDRCYSGYLGPSEYRKMIIPHCEDEGIEFVPVDWYEDDMVDWDYMRNYSKDQKYKFAKDLEEVYEKIWAVGRKSLLPMNSFELDKIIIQKQEWFNSLDPVMHNVYWIARNQLMIERIKKVINNNQDKRILCTVGAEHNYFYYNELKNLKCRLIYPLK